MVESKNYIEYHSRSVLNKTIHNLEGLLNGLNIDKKITTDELEELKNWYYLNKETFNFHPFNEIIKSIEKALEDNYLSSEEIEDILWVCNNLKKLKRGTYYDIITTDIQKLHGILYGILADNKIDDSEVYELKKWIIENDSLKNTYPYEEVYSLLLGILEDNKITEYERNLLKVFFSDFIDKTTSYNINQLEIDELRKEIHVNGICSIDPEIEINGNLFCFTGVSSKTTRKDFATLIEKLGGFYKDNITNDTRYLIVGNECNPCWAFSCYGRKIQKAMELRKKGKNILIVHENDFWDII